MFDLMYEEIYNSQTGAVERRKLTPERVVALLDPKAPGAKRRDDLLDLNVVFKRQTKKSLLAVRLYSFLVDKKEDKKNPNSPVVRTPEGHAVKERVVKFQFESGLFDQSRQQGSRMTSQMRFNMDIHEFAYFCEIMKSGRILSLIARNEKIAVETGKKYADPGFEIYKDVDGVGRRFKIYRGSSADICIETSQEPSQNGRGGNQQAAPVRIVHGLSLEEAGQMGAMGALALETLNMWYAFGKAEENLSLINTRPKREKENARSYQNEAQNAPYRGNERNDYGRGGYDGYDRPQRRDSGYAAGSYNAGYGNGYQQQGAW